MEGYTTGEFSGDLAIDSIQLTSGRCISEFKRFFSDVSFHFSIESSMLELNDQQKLPC